MECLVGVAFRDFVLVAADTNIIQNILVIKKGIYTVRLNKYCSFRVSF